MKVCESCGEEYGGRDGDNVCPACEQANTTRRRRRSLARREREAVMRDLGMVKVRGALGGTYWE